MKTRSFIARTVFAIALGFLMGASSATLAQGGRPPQSNLSPEEQSMLKTIMTTPDPAAKLKAVEVLIKKHPKTSIRERVARQSADAIADVKDAAQKATLAQQYAAIFTEPAEQQMIMPVLIEGLVGARKFEEAFATGSEFLTHNPDSLFVLVQLVSAGTDQAKQKNPKFIPQSLQYGSHAVELIESDKKPAELDDAAWKQYKSTMLPSLYQSMGMLNLIKGDRVAAKAGLNKAAALTPNDPFNYLLLAGVLNDEYQERAAHYRSVPAGPARDEELKIVHGLLDQVIDAYAHTIALAEGNERLQAVRQQYLGDLEAYYKYRHNNSTEGMQQLIDKYKLPAK